MQARDIDKALDGFTRAVQLDPDNGEAWNNIACLYVFLTFRSTVFLLCNHLLYFVPFTILFVFSCLCTLRMMQAYDQEKE